MVFYTNAMQFFSYYCFWIIVFKKAEKAPEKFIYSILAIQVARLSGGNT